MANPLRGEVDLVVGDKTYTMRLSTNALVTAEEVLGCGPDEIIETLQPGAFRLGTLRALLFAGLHKNHPDLSLDDAGDMIGELGVPFVLDQVSESMRTSLPKREGENPRTASRRGTGKNS